MEQEQKTQTMNTVQSLTAEQLLALKDGVDYIFGRGAYCPICKAKLKSYNTQPWRDGFRVRYHRCTDPDCILAITKKCVKSIEVEQQTKKTMKRLEKWKALVKKTA